MKKNLIYVSIISIVATQMGSATEVANYRLYGFQTIETIQTLRAKNLSLREQREAMEMQVATDQSLRDQEMEQLKAELARMTQEMRKEEATKMALKRELVARDEEQRETNQLLDDILTQRTPSQVLSLSQETPQVALPLKSSMFLETSTLSTYQQQLLSPWKEGKIGPKAWAALGGDNVSLAEALLRGIRECFQHCSVANVDIFNQESNNFTLLLNGKGQKKPFKF